MYGEGWFFWCVGFGFCFCSVVVFVLFLFFFEGVFFVCLGVFCFVFFLIKVGY